jgi:hypothetical protein
MTNSSATPPGNGRAPVPSIAWVLLAVTTGLIAAQFYGRGAFFLIVAGAVLLGAVFILWNSVQALTGDAPLTLEEALTLTAPSTEEERKVAVLRVLKDLEYERSVGKLSEDDYVDLTRKYRQEAKQLLQALDDTMGPARERALALLAERMKHATASETGARGEATLLSSSDTEAPSSEEKSS